MNALCKFCLYYNTINKTCSRALVVVSNTELYHDCAKLVRLDKSRCGPQAKWFEEDKGPSGLLKSSASKNTLDDAEHVVQELRILLTG